MDDFEDTPTPTVPVVRHPSADAISIAELAGVLNALATEYGKAAGIFDRLEPDERQLFKRRIAKEAHRTASAIHELADGFDRP